MSLKRYNLEADFGVPYMDEEPTGEWVRLDDVVKLLEKHLPKTLHLAYEVCVDETGLYNANEAVFVKDALIALVKGEQK